MPGMDRDLVLEALSTLTNASVKCLDPGESTDSELTVYNFISTTFNYTVDSVNVVASLLKKIALGSSEMDHLHNELFMDMENFFDPIYDYDFRNMTDSSECSRGGEPYKRPVGWYRFALKVKNKYPDGNAWLGSIGWRTQSEPGEWPVSFHGTTIEGAKGIARLHFKAGDRCAYGRGIYSTPDITIAKGYTKTFISKKTGKTYKVIMQNRINPQKRKITVKPGFWLIPVPEGTTAEQEKEIVESSIRPYGILIKEVTQ
ncbi:uncharacterized protein LOC124393446 [Silurus meridionalis]|uniref:Uncharacterized protein n=1 Tax=Silurus meridionalis TaxID=175797 RepID=A0A8T0BVF3_SILME|nr:uncharacterized protein LOC124393446 [Silurus meridionalis]KAF7710998.1 hypothetical protein HF521_000009 [Silurus meridionalis]